jgi:hypothetical protein
VVSELEEEELVFEDVAPLEEDGNKKLHDDKLVKATTPPRARMVFFIKNSPTIFPILMPRQKPRKYRN